MSCDPKPNGAEPFTDVPINGILTLSAVSPVQCSVMHCAIPHAGVQAAAAARRPVMDPNFRWTKESKPDVSTARDDRAQNPKQHIGVERALVRLVHHQARVAADRAATMSADGPPSAEHLLGFRTLSAQPRTSGQPRGSGRKADSPVGWLQRLSAHSASSAPVSDDSRLQRALRAYY